MFLNRSIKLLSFFLIFIIMIGCNSETVVKDSDSNNDESEKSEQTNGKISDKEISGELKVAYSAQPLSLDPHATAATATSDIMGHVYETLVTFDSEYNIQPMLADSYEYNEDGTIITFHLRQGVLFHNGEEMKAEDVVASMNRWIAGPSSRENFVGSKFEVVDDYTVELHLTKPLSTAMAALAHAGAGFAGIIPKSSIEAAGENGLEEYIGTGPFKFEEWKQDQYVHLKRFENYKSRTEPSDGLSGQKAALVEDLYFMFVTDSSTRLAGIQSGEYDVAHAMPYDSVEIIKNDPNIKNFVYPGGYLSVYFNKKKGLFTDVKARHAVNLAINKTDVLTAAYSYDEYFVSNSNIMMNHQKQWTSDLWKEYHNEYDPEEAKQLLEEIGYTGEEIKLIVTRDYEDQYNGGVVVQEQLEQIGMNVKLEVYDWPTFLDYREDEDKWDIHIMANTEVPEPATTSFLKSSLSGWVNSPELDKLLDEFKSKPTLEDAREMYDDLVEWYWDYLPVVKFGDYYRVSSVRSTVSDFKYQSGFIFWNIYNNK